MKQWTLIIAVLLTTVSASAKTTVIQSGKFLGVCTPENHCRVLPEGTGIQVYRVVSDGVVYELTDRSRKNPLRHYAVGDSVTLRLDLPHHILNVTTYNRWTANESRYKIIGTEVALDK